MRIDDTRWILDMEALTKYNGKGRCENIVLLLDREDMNRRQRLRDWAQDRNWSVATDFECGPGYMIGAQRETEIPNLLIKRK